MKVTMNVECTPEEARAFFGLPDVQPLQEAVLKEMERQMKENIAAMSPDKMMQLWFPAGIKGAEDMQKMFWGNVQQMMAMGGKAG
jgi:Family of unknown function (DUF6489)